MRTDKQYYEWRDEWPDEYCEWTYIYQEWKEECYEETDEWVDEFYDGINEYYKWENKHYEWEKSNINLLVVTLPCFKLIKKLITFLATQFISLTYEKKPATEINVNSW